MDRRRTMAIVLRREINQIGRARPIGKEEAEAVSAVAQWDATAGWVEMEWMARRG